MIRPSLLPVVAAALCLATGVRAAPETSPSPAGVGSEISEPYLFEVVRHLYRWYMDEQDIEHTTSDDTTVFWVRQRHPELDPGDQSLLFDILMPRLGVLVTVKKADYMIEELDLVVKSDSFKIINVARTPVPDQPPAGARVVEASYRKMREYLFKTRKQAAFPDDELLDRMRASVRKKLEEDAASNDETTAGREEVIHISPLSPVANELWIFWETGRLLLRFASDIDLANPAVWQHDELAVDLYDVDEQVVVSMNEVAGSNAYMTRDQVGRALFNCIVLGKRMSVTRRDSTPAPPAEAP